MNTLPDAKTMLDNALTHIDTLLNFVRYQSHVNGTSEHAYTFNMIETVLQLAESDVTQVHQLLKQVSK